MGYHNLALLIFWLTGTAWAAESSQVTHPCTPKESWSISAAIAKPIRRELAEHLEQAKETKLPLKDQLALMDRVVSRYQSSKVKEERILAGFAMARSYLAMGYVHLAHQLFQSVLKQFPPTPEIAPVELAMVSCLNGIHESYPSLAVSDETLAIFNRLTSFARSAGDWQALQEGEFHFLQQSIRQGEPVTEASFQAFHHAGAFADLGRAILMLKAGNEKQASVALVHFVQATKRKDSRYADLAYLLLARIQAANRKTNLALGLLKKVPASSNYLPEALADMGALYYASQQHGKAVDALLNLEVGPLARSYQPAANVKLARSLVGLCQYPAALRVLKNYNARYGEARSILEQALASGDFYRQVVGFRSVEKPSMALRLVVMEWIRSPSFLISQSEVNLILNEKAKAEAQREQIQKADQTLALGVGGKALLSSLKIFSEKISTRETELVRQVNSELRKTSRQMLSAVNHAEESASLLEADIYRLAGTQIARFPEEGAEPAKSEATSHPKEKVLSWGRIPAAELDSAEVWQDELGALKALANNECHG